MTDNEIATLDIWELARKHHARVTTTCEFDFDELKNYTIEVWQAATAVERERCALVWLPIADAPKDAYVLLWIDIVIGHPLVVQGCWFHDDDEDEKGWIDLDGKVLHATHWMPLTPPPAIRQGGDT